MVHRLDGLRGIYTGTSIPNDLQQIEISNLVDYIIFQSKFSLYCFRQHGYEADNHTIVFNGIDPEKFAFTNRELPEKDKPIRLIASSWSTAEMKGFATISSLSEFAGFEVHFVGRWNENIDSKNVILHQPLTHTQLVKLYKNMNLFLHAAENDPCPNVVIEALASGMPIVHINSGGPLN